MAQKALGVVLAGASGCADLGGGTELICVALEALKTERVGRSLPWRGRLWV